MSEVKKVIKVFEDGAYEDVEHGVLIGCNGDDFNLQFMDVSPMDMCRAAIGLVEGIKKLGLEKLMDELSSFYADEEKPEVKFMEKESRLLIVLKEGKVEFQTENTDMVELATMCGALEQLMGVEAIRRGKSLDDVKDSMLDIHLAAMQTLTEQIIREKEESDGI